MDPLGECARPVQDIPVEHLGADEASGSLRRAAAAESERIGGGQVSQRALVGSQGGWPRGRQDNDIRM